ncbi:SPOR domain-containing protein [Donghicola sp. C2-DW-16]|uniref:SPOR domain-containing protein n=1 Tax=Donghicola mangrovi TaxID=2729614 RepID=A0ABX2PGX0_9RHOB|nr:SPOR domain-containing protein [Donghicola mangrovi]NVO28319.1 SPOR domain-containing protein [Donghicola mangrovi]
MAQTPVNFPPSDFQGRQFVDNKGCAFIRVGVGPTVDWVPRVTRDRQQVCGLQPTFRTPTQTVEAPKAPVPTPAPVITPKPTPAPAAKTAAKVAEPAPAPVAKAAPVVKAPAKQKVAVAAPVKKRTTTAKPMETVASKIVRPTAQTKTVAKAAVLAPTTVTSAQPVAKTRPVTAQPAPAATASVCPGRTGVSARYTNKEGVRCGPQSASPVSIISVGAANQPLPKPPAGYKQVWKDDRLNPYRGPRTAEGNVQSDQVWDTQTPRSLRPGAEAQRVAVVTPQATAPVTTSAGIGSYVQVGTFSVNGNAQRTAQRFQSAGYPVRLLTTRSGQQIVLVGAANGAGLQQTLNAARKAGFSDAFIR